MQTSMATPEKPNVEFAAPEREPSAEDLYSDPAEKILFAGHEGMSGFWRFMIPLVVLLLASAAVFVFVA
jgi:hypothetical protein